MKKLFILILAIAGISAYSQSYEIDTYNNQTINTCSGNIYDSNSGGDYGNSEDYNVTICSSTAGQQIQIEFAYITEAGYDYLDIYDGTNTSAPYLGRIWGDYSAGSVTETIVAVSKNSGGCLHLVWHSDGSVTDPGFNGTISCVASSSGAPTVQDCLGAIPICGDSYSTTAAYSGEGSYVDEINGVSSCLSVGERNDVWYVFTAQQTTNITFTLNPNGADDYDWAMYDLTNANCEDIFYNPSLEISCNYAIDDGSGLNTGASSGGNGSHQDGDGTQWNDPIPVVTDGVYLINVSNFSSSQSGYLIDFSASSGAMVDNTAPLLDQITSSPACGEDEITFDFTERVLCSSVDASDFNISGPGGPYTVTSINCNSGATYSQSFTITLNTALTAGGTYDLNLTGQVDDACGNTVNGNSLSFSVSGVVGSASVTQNVTCNGGSDGTAIASASGGTSPYHYNWDNGQTTSSSSGLSAGTHYVTITDNIGVCNDVQSVTITQPSAISVSFSTTDVLCNGGIDGVATANPSGGNGATWTYQWDAAAGGGTSATTSTLSAGTTYTVSVYDNQNCLQTATVSVSEPTALAIDGISQQQPLCYGDNNGQLSVINPHGGTPNYTYNWSPSGGTGQTATGLGANTYSVTVEDAHNCTLVQNNIVLGQPSALANTNTVTDATCNGSSTGSIATNASGGTGSLTYTWSANTGGQTSATASSLPAGDYDVTIEDENNCTLVNSSITVSEDPAIVITETANADATCGNADGSAVVSASGGSGSGYSYTWDTSPTQTGTTISNVIAGAYNVTVTDSHNCNEVATINIDNAAAPSISEVGASHVDVLCNGDNTGQATVTGSGGTGTLTYAWSSSSNTGTTETGLGAGTYTASVTDENNCVSTVNITIDEPNALNIIISAQQNPTCNGGNNGQATASSSGGPTGTTYTYLWSAGGNINSATNTGLSAGTYTVTVTDDNGCEATTSVTISEPDAVSIDATSSADPLCFGNSNGTATVTTVSGGTSGTGIYNYIWDSNTGNQTGNSATGLSAGTYYVTVSDDNGCTATTSVTLNQPTLLQASTTVTDVQCNGDNDGTATVTGSGGTGSYSYTWDINTGNQTGQTATGLVVGTYNVTVTDGNSCEATSSATISQPTALTSSISFNNVNCYGESNAYAIVTAQNGTPNYSYSWSNSQNTDSIGGLSIGTYYVTITDSHSCTKTDSVLISQPALLDIIPSTVDVNCHGGNDGQGNIVITGGTTPYTFLWSNGEVTQNIIDIAGNYDVTVTDNHGCTAVESLVINEPDTISVLTNITNPNCGNADGSATVTPSGGVGSYNYVWSVNAGSGTTNTVSNLGAGAYNVSITDNNSCLFVQDISLSDNGAATIAVINLVHNTCYQDSLGSAETQVVSGGNAPFTYYWINNSDTLQNSLVNTIDSLWAGVYSVVVQDSVGCVSTETFTINENSVINVNLNFVAGVNCYGDSTAITTVTASGGTVANDFVYSWAHDPLLTNSFASNLSAGTYTVTVTDDSLCTASAQITFNNPSLLSVVLDTSINVSCFGGDNASILIQPVGGTAPYSYYWDNGDVAAYTDTLQAGSHYVTVTDANLCTVVDTFDITQPSAITVNITTTNSICGSATGTITVNASNGTPGTITDYTYQWSHDTTITINNATNLAQNTYYITVTDSLGCVLDTSAQVVDDGAGIVNISSLSDVLCYGESTGTASFNMNGGTAAFTYVISMSGINIDSTQTSNSNYNISNLVYGNYDVVVYDANGCVSDTSFEISQPDSALLVVENHNNISCYGLNDGEISLIVSGGTPTYTYLWNNQLTTQNLTNIGEGYYSAYISDNNNCTYNIDSIHILSPLALDLAISDITDASCYNDSTGSINISVEGGTPEYTYLWSNGDTISNITGLPSGNYILTLTDANNCTDTISANISNPTELMLTDSVKEEDYAGFISLYPIGGTKPYTYIWSNEVTTSTNEYLSSGNYYVTVTDANGCAVLNSYTIEIPLIVPTVITPNGDGKNDYFNITNIESVDNVKINVFNRWGDLIFNFEDEGLKYKEQDSQWNGTDLNGHELPIGSYVYIIEIEGELKPYKGTVTIIK